MTAATRMLITPIFRSSYPKLVQPVPFMQNGKAKGDPKFSLQMLFDMEDMGSFKIYNEESQMFEDVDISRVCVTVAKEAFGSDFDVKEAVNAKELSWPIKTGDKLAEKLEMKKKNGDHLKGKKVISASANQDYPPTLVYKEDGKKKTINRGLDSEEAKAKQLFDAGGSYAYAEVTVKASELGDDKYVTFYVNSVCYVKSGPRIGGQSLMDRFEGVSGGAADVDPTGGEDDIDEDITV